MQRESTWKALLNCAFCAQIVCPAELSSWLLFSSYVTNYSFFGSAFVLFQGYTITVRYILSFNKIREI